MVCAVVSSAFLFSLILSGQQSFEHNQSFPDSLLSVFPVAFCLFPLSWHVLALLFCESQGFFCYPFVFFRHPRVPFRSVLVSSILPLFLASLVPGTRPQVLLTLSASLSSTASFGWVSCARWPFPRSVTSYAYLSDVLRISSLDPVLHVFSVCIFGQASCQMPFFVTDRTTERWFPGVCPALPTDQRRKNGSPFFLGGFGFQIGAPVFSSLFVCPFPSAIGVSPPMRGLGFSFPFGYGIPVWGLGPPLGEGGGGGGRTNRKRERTLSCSRKSVNGPVLPRT